MIKITIFISFPLIIFPAILLAAEPDLQGPPPVPVQSVESLVTGNAAARICLNDCADTLRQCVAACPEPEVSSDNPDIESPTCMMQCVSDYIGCYDGC